MDIYTHPLCNQTIGKPSDMTDEDCVALPVFNFQDEHGKWTRSFWKPTESELKALVSVGGTVALNVRAQGRQHLVVGVSVALEYPLPPKAKEDIDYAARFLAAYERRLPIEIGKNDLRSRLSAMLMAIKEMV